MKLAVVFLALLCLLNTDGTAAVSQPSAVNIKWMSQKLDNFNSTSTATWKMRYMVNEKYFQKGGPIFIYVGGEQAIEAPFIEWGLLADMAAAHNGILFYPEHRFYGQSRVGKSLIMDNLRFLNAHQALGDLAHFISTQRKTDPRLENAKVILSGCSYAGSLAVWFNRLYPKIVDGTWALSAPILAKADFPEYLEITGKAIRELGSPQCYERLHKGIEELQTMFSDGRSKEAKAMLKLCDYFDDTKPEDIWTLFRAISHLFATLVTNRKWESAEVTDACDFLMKSPDDLSAVVAYFIEYYTSVDNNCKSLNYLGTVYYNNKTSYNNIVPRQWMYQTCNEFGWFQGTAPNLQPFGRSSPVDLDNSHCYDIFGSDFTEHRIREKIAETNRAFGGRSPNVKNIHMTYGSLDPWSALGPGESEVSTVVPLYSHCAHINSISDLDSPEMVASKRQVLAKVRQWLA